MKTIGMIGGMSWESTQHYYQIMNRHIQSRLGKHNSIESIIYSVNFERVLEFVEKDEWGVVGSMIISLAKKLEAADADFLIMTSNAIHKVFEAVEEAINIPILHIADPTGLAIQKCKIKKVGLLGTKVTMGEDFYKSRLQNRYNLEVFVPEKDEQDFIHETIFNELTLGKIREESRIQLITLIHKFSEKGVGGVILGCTELTLLISQKDITIPVFDTTDLHAKAAVEAAI